MLYNSHYCYIPPYSSPYVDNVYLGGFLMDKYINSQPDGTPVADQDADVGLVPSVSRVTSSYWTNVTLPQAMIACANRGAGWHLTSPLEWASVAYLSKQHNTQPFGTNWSAPGITLGGSYNYDYNSGERFNNKWFHNHLPSGILDLNGNKSEFIMLFMNSNGWLYVPYSYSTSTLSHYTLTQAGSPYGRGLYDNSAKTITCDFLTSSDGMIWGKNWSVSDFSNKYIYVAESNLSGVANAPYNLSLITSNTDRVITLTDSINDGDNLDGLNVTFVVLELVSSVDITYGTTQQNNAIGSIHTNSTFKSLAIPGGSSVEDEYSGRFYWRKPIGSNLAFGRRGGALAYSSTPGGLAAIQHTQFGASAGIFSLALSDLYYYSSYYSFRACKAL